MIAPQLGAIYKFTFVGNFSQYDGIYRVDEIISYTRALELEISFNDLYVGVGYTSEDHVAAIEELRNSAVYKLVHIETTYETEPLYMPLVLFKDIPDGSVKEYSKIAVAFNLGPFDDPEQLSALAEFMKEVLRAVVGVETEESLFEFGKAYLTDSEMVALKASREAYKNNTVHDYRTESIKQRIAIEKLKAIIKYYEDTITGG